MLEKDPGLVNATNELGESVLHFLAVENNRPAVEWLHERGADLNTVNQFGTPLLFEVALLGYDDLLSWLIEQGADVEKKNADGQRIDGYLAEFGKTGMKDYLKKVLDL